MSAPEIAPCRCGNETLFWSYSGDLVRYGCNCGICGPWKLGMSAAITAWNAVHGRSGVEERIRAIVERELRPGAPMPSGMPDREWTLGYKAAMVDIRSALGAAQKEANRDEV